MRTELGDSVSILGGSANLTRRNLRDYNLETDLHFFQPAGARIAMETAAYFNRLFRNESGSYTLPLAAYLDDRWIGKAIYRIQEVTGFCTY